MPLAHPHHRSTFSHVFIKRSGVSPSESASSSPVASTVAQTTGAGVASSSVYVASIVAGILSVLVLVGGLLVWKFRFCNKRKDKRPVSLESQVSMEKNRYTYFGQEKIDFKSSTYVEKPKAVYKLESANTDNVGWAPQVTNHRGVHMTPKQLQAIQSSPKKYAKWEKALQLNLERSPPPYNSDPANIMLPPTPPEAAHSPPPPTPPANSKSKSFTADSQPASNLERSSSNKQKHRLMKVANTYTPQLDDEIAVTIGETVRLVEEYQDGWCYIQRKNSKTGVVPRSCLVERSRI